MDIQKRILSALLALVLLIGTVPVPVYASETDAVEVLETEAVETTALAETAEETEIPETTAATETEPAVTEPEETEPAETEPAATQPEETEALETEPEETLPQETVPAETEAEIEIEAEGQDEANTGERAGSVITQAQFDTLLANAKKSGYLELNDLITLTKDVTIPENVRLYIGWEGGIVVPSGRTLTVCGGGDIYGSLQVQQGGKLELKNNLLWVEAGEVDIQGTYVRNEWAFLYGVVQNGALWGTISGVSKQDMGVYVRVENDYYWEENLAFFQDPDYLFNNLGIQGDVTLDVDLTVGANRNICVEGMEGNWLTIDEDVTLTTGSHITVYEGYGLTNNGTIVLNSDYGNTLEIEGTMTNNGTVKNNRNSYIRVSAGGELINNESIVNNWDIYVEGELTNYGHIEMTDTGNPGFYTLLQIEAGGSAGNYGDVDCYGAGTVNVLGSWNGRDPVYHSIPGPVNLSWHKLARWTDNTVHQAKGHIYWQTSEPEFGNYVIHIYNADNDEQVYRDNCNFGGLQNNDRSLPSFIQADLPSGNYYFTVTSVSESGEYEDSAAVRSDVFSYTRPLYAMANPRNVRWNGLAASWDAPSTADALTSYQVQWCYAPDADSEPTVQSADTNVFSLGKNLPLWMTENLGAGYYSFRVRVIPGDGTKYTIGEWVESAQFYYDPATFAYDETYLINLHNQNPPGMPADIEFKLLQAPVRLQNDLSLPGNTSLDIMRGGSIIVPAGKTFTLNHYSQVYNGGKLIVEEGGKLIINDTLWLGHEGTLQIDGEIEFGPDAWVNFNYGNSFTMRNVPDEHVFVEVLFDPGCTVVENMLSFFENSQWGWTVLRVEGDMTLPRNVTSPVNSNIYIPEDSSLTIPQGTTLSLPGGAQMCVDGRLYNDGIIQGLEVHEGPEAVLFIPENGYVRNNGRVVANPGTAVEALGVWEGYAPVRNGGVVNMPMSFKDFKAQVEAAAKQSQGATVEVSKNVILEGSLTVPKNVYLAFNGGSITVPNGKTLTLNGGASLNEEGCLKVEAGGKLILNESVWVNWNGRLINNGTVTFGKNGYGQRAVVYFNYGSEYGEVTGISHGDQILVVEVYDFKSPDWPSYKNAFENNDYLEAQLEIWGGNKPVLEEDLTVPANGMLIINPSWDDIQNGTREDWVVINSDVEVYGIMWVNARYNGTPCSLEIKGNVSVRDGGVLNISGNVLNNGHVYAYYGSQVNDYREEFKAKWEGRGIENVGLIDQYELEQELADDGSYELQDAVVLERNLVLSDAELVIGEEGWLIVPEGVTLTVNRATDVRGKLDVRKGGKLVHNDRLTVYPGAEILNAGTYTAGTGRVEVLAQGTRLPAVTGIAKKYQRVSFADADLAQLNYAIGLQKDGYEMIRVQCWDLTLQENVTIPKVITLEISGTLTVNGNLTLNGTVAAGESAAVINNGSFTMNKGSRLEFRGTWEGAQPVNKGGVTDPQATAVTIAGEAALTLDLVQANDWELTVSVAGDDPLQYVAWTSSNKKVVDPANIVYENGVYRITKAAVGTTKLTATSVATDGSGKTFTDILNLTVIPIQVHTLTLEPLDLKLDKAALTDAASRTFVITPEAIDRYGQLLTLNNKSLKWTSSNTKLASVKVNSDGSATVTIAANKDGTAVITAQSTDLAKVTATMSLLVYDKAPELGTAAVTLNPMMLSGTDVALIPGYENAIEAVSVDSADLDVDYNGETQTLNIKANKDLKNSTVNTKLYVTCEDGKTYELSLKVTVKNTVPAITVKQNVKMDLFYKDSEANLTVTAKNAVVEKLELIGTDDFVLTEDGTVSFTKTLEERYAENIKYKPVTKATLLVYLEDYAAPVEKVITISTTATKLSLSTDPASSTVNTNSKFNAAPDVFFHLYNKSAKQVLDLTEQDDLVITGYENAVTVDTDSDTLWLTLQEAKKTTLNISVQLENWMYPVALTHNVAVSTKDPSVKLGKSTLKLNTNVPDLTDSTSVTLTDCNLSLNGFGTDNLFVSAAQVGSDAWLNAQMIRLEYDGNEIVASIVPGTTPKAGTYTFTAAPDVNGEALKAVTVKVSVTSAMPKLTLGAKGKLDAILPESALTYTVTKVANVEAAPDRIFIHKIEVNGVEQSVDLFRLTDLELDAKGKQFFTLKLNPDAEYLTKVTYKVTFGYELCGETFYENPVNVKVTQSALKAKLTAQQYVPGQASVAVDVQLTAPVGAQLEKIVINEAKTAAALLTALDGTILGENLLENAVNGVLTLAVADGSGLVPGKSYTLALDITPEGHAGDVNPTTVTVSIKIAK